MATERKPPDLIKQKSGYKLARSVRTEFDQKYGIHENFALVSSFLQGLPDKIPNLGEKSFFHEALICYKHRAFRACIVMIWNLAFDHLVRWIHQDAARLARFNAALIARYPKRGIIVANREDFEEMTESEAVEVCKAAKLVSKNIIDILREKLKRRNMAAHPSQIMVTQSQADDVVTDLMHNVVLALT